MGEHGPTPETARTRSSTTVPVEAGWRARNRTARPGLVLGVAMLLGSIYVLGSARRPDARLVAETSVSAWGAVLLLSLAAPASS